MLDFQTTVRSRQSIRDFLDKPLSKDEINEILLDAQWAPSATNTQPWITHVVSGQKAKELKEILKDKWAKGEIKSDFPYDQSLFPPALETRMRALYKLIYDGFGVAREDKAGRARMVPLNLEFYGAPHAAFLFMPSIADNVNVAADMGMYAQNFMLSCTARGYGSIPQLIFAMFADTIRKELGVSDELKLLFGISFGYPNWDANVNKNRTQRVSLSESVTFHE
ncbi:nitroreductase [Campylobacter suis]|uniref:Nitroreductase NfnB n=1 Tax=Campylobacter suis TaxID=2790657 RepID=A0ABM8Q2S4_9BACT|nr:nitroreductase [Campylobacter suis]CAD7287074.1 Nitroreductase NfnB [Campylobacter suis]